MSPEKLVFTSKHSKAFAYVVVRDGRLLSACVRCGTSYCEQL